MLAAGRHGLGNGTGWFGTDEAQVKARDILSIPSRRHVWSAVGFGYVDTSTPQRATSVTGGRKPLEEIVSYGHYGDRQKEI